MSAAPLLEKNDLTRRLEDGTLHWVSVGGASGPRAGPMALDWACDLLDQSVKANVSSFLKQLGDRRGSQAGPDAVLDGATWVGVPGRNGHR